MFTLTHCPLLVSRPRAVPWFNLHPHWTSVCVCTRLCSKMTTNSSSKPCGRLIQFNRGWLARLHVDKLLTRCVSSCLEQCREKVPTRSGIRFNCSWELGVEYQMEIGNFLKEIFLENIYVYVYMRFFFVQHELDIYSFLCCRIKQGLMGKVVGGHLMLYSFAETWLSCRDLLEAVSSAMEFSALSGLGREPVHVITSFSSRRNSRSMWSYNRIVMFLQCYSYIL